MPRKSDPNAPNKPRGKAFRPGEDERRLDTREPKPPLPDLPDETDVQAMEAVWLAKGKAQTQRQDSFTPLYRKDPGRFFDRLQSLKRGQPAPASDDPLPGAGEGVGYDGAGACPTCGREPPLPKDDIETRIEELLAAED